MQPGIMKCLVVFVCLALVGVTFGEISEWSQPDDINSDDTTVSAGVDDVKLDDIMQNFDMDSLVKDELSVPDADSVGIDTLEHTLSGGACVCKEHKCDCCFNHQYRVLWKKYNINVCARVSWAGNKFYFKMTFSGAVVYRSYVTRNLAVCKRFPRTITAKACVKLYSVNLSRRSFCIHMYDRSWRRHVTQLNKCFRFIGDNDIAEASNQLE